MTSDFARSILRKYIPPPHLNPNRPPPRLIALPEELSWLTRAADQTPVKPHPFILFIISPPRPRSLSTLSTPGEGEGGLDLICCNDSRGGIFKGAMVELQATYLCSLVAWLKPTSQHHGTKYIHGKLHLDPGEI